MSTLLIIGAGGVGGVVAHKAAKNMDVFDKIYMASRTLSKVEAICNDIGGGKVTPLQVDADNVPELVALIKKLKPAMVLNVALPYQDLHIMDACLEAGVHYLDTANYEPLDVAKFEYSWQWAYNDRFQKAGLMALLGSGFDPGVTSVMSTYLLKHHFDQIETLDILDANGGDHGYPFATNFNPEINIREVTAKGRYYENGEWKETAPLSVKQEFDFEGIGKKNMYVMYHEELESLAKFIPGVKRIRFFMTFGDSYLKHLEVLGNVGMTRIDPVKFQGTEIVPIQFLRALLPDPASLGPRTKGKTNIGVIAKGTKDGKEKRVYIYQICDHQESYAEVKSQAISYTTGVPAVVGAKMMMTGKWMKPGVWNMEQFDPDPFMEELAKQGLPWKVRELKPGECEINV
jgi:saccharopine dehydrogenase (NAD+, L-lysine-forming)